jgi:hypothetical protein
MALLDLNKFPMVENSIGWLAFNHLQEYPSLINKGDITQRIYGCSNFLYYKIDDKNSFSVESAYLRAALNEFVSISEMIKVSTDLKLNKLTIENSDLPLLHFFKLLREVNFHLNSFQYNKTTSEVQSFDVTTGEIDKKVFTLRNIVINQLNVSIFKNSKNIKHYDLTQMSTVTEWVNDKQYQWGIFHILDLALRQYCIKIEKCC